MEDANLKCEQAIRQNLENIERSDEDVFLRVMEATRKQEELRCINIVEGSLAEAAAAHEKECKEQITIEKKVGVTLYFVCKVNDIFTRQVSENEVDAECRVRTASAVRTAVVRDRQESEQVCRMMLQELSRHEVARCREHSQVTQHCNTAVVQVLPRNR